MPVQPVSVSQFLVLHLSSQHYQGIRCHCPRGLITTVREVCAPSVLDRGTQQMVSARTACLKPIPTLFASRTEPQEFYFFDHTVHNSKISRPSTESGPQTSQRQLHIQPASPGEVNRICLIASRILSRRGARVIGLDVKSKDDGLRVWTTSSTSAGGARSGHRGWWRRGIFFTLRELGSAF